MSQRLAADREPPATTWLSGLAALVGIWIVVSNVVWEPTQAGLWNNAIVGVAILLVAGFNYYRLANNRPSNVAAMTLVALLGLWMIISPFAFEVGHELLLWSAVVSGIIVGICGAYVAYERRSSHDRNHHPNALIEASLAEPSWG
ncbi:MAG: SPW repeat protein [Natrialbaceae archaeon]|nr:SPW repeat protein [Natrialbaceae archaeon]